MLARENGLQTLADLVDRNARLHGENLHLVFESTRSNFSRLAERSYRLASALYKLGVRRQDRVGMLAMNCAEYLDVYGACEVAPFIASPVNFRLASPEIGWIVRDAAPRVLIVEQQYVAMVAALRSELPSVQQYVVVGGPVPEWATGFEELLASGDPAGPPLRPGADDIHAIMYTSGTTGRPKGAMLSHATMLATGEGWAMELEVDLGGKILLAMPLFHIGARSQGMAATFRGASMVLLKSFDARLLLETIPRERITQVHLAPTLVQAVLNDPEHERFDLSSLRTINYAAAPMPLTTLKRALKRFGPIMINGYGQTEGSGTTLRKFYHLPEGSERDLKRLTSVGQAVACATVRIAGAADESLPEGQIGEICFRSPQNMVGYWNNSVATMEALRNGWLHTGDLGHMDADGFVYLVDRKKDMILSGGENVYSREVEEALMEHGAVTDAAVIGIADDKWGEAVKAIVVLKSGASATAAELIAHCRTLIAGYKCPKSIDFVDELPRLPSGKISKVMLRNRYESKTR